MAKFYVQSGNFRSIISADDSDKAALWAVHCALRQVVPVYEDEELSSQEKGEVAACEGIRVLGNTICISEVGFDRADCESFDTFDYMVQWHQLMVALARLERLLK